MKTAFFYAVKPGNIIGDGSIGDLRDWIERFINATFFEHGIEYWSRDVRSRTNELKPFQPAPVGTADMTKLQHFACYVVRGSCEGHFVEIAGRMHDGTVVRIGSAKSFGGADQCWKMARAISEALDSIYFYCETPEIVDMFDKVPRQPNWKYEACQSSSIAIRHTLVSIHVTTSTGLILDNRNWGSEGPNAHFHVEPRLKDWLQVLMNLKANFACSSVAQVVVDDLPGYTISHRGNEDITGFYVLPPGGDPADDRTYLGYFDNADKAVAAERNHRDTKDAAALLTAA